MTDRDLAEINERNIEEFSLLAGTYGEVFDGSDVKWAYTGTKAFNRILDPVFSENQVDSRISELLSFFGARGVNVNWVIGPSSTPGDIGERIRQRGFRRIEWAGMAQDSADLPDVCHVPTGLEVHEIADASDFKPWGRVLCRGFGWHASIEADFHATFSRLGYSDNLPLKHYFGYFNGRPASACSIFEGKECRGVYLVAVDPDFRRLGIGIATTHLALSAARRTGDRLTVLQASPMGKGVYEKLGFTTHCTMGFYVPGP